MPQLRRLAVSFNHENLKKAYLTVQDGGRTVFNVTGCLLILCFPIIFPFFKLKINDGSLITGETPQSPDVIALSDAVTISLVLPLSVAQDGFSAAFTLVSKSESHKNKTETFYKHSKMKAVFVLKCVFQAAVWLCVE